MNVSKESCLVVCIISDITLAPYFVPLMKEFFGENIILYSIPYGEHNNDKYKNQIIESDIIIVWLNFETTYSKICDTLYSNFSVKPQIIKNVVDSCEKLYTDISSYTNANIIWFLFEDYFNKFSVIEGYKYNSFIDKINFNLSDTIKDNVIFIDLMHIIAEVGIANAYNMKGRYRWNSPYSKALIEMAVKTIHKQYLIEKGVTKKCIILDCDNVLWGGIISEDGIENLKLNGSGLGRSYQDFQRIVLSLYHHGAILAVCSKNDLSDVMIMFREHSEMILKEDHIACFQVNWGNKVDGIKRIAKCLNINLDSMVFVDDSPVEIELIKTFLPEVTAILYERDTICEMLSCFNLKHDVNLLNIEKRNKTYKTNQFREVLKSQYEDYKDYISALDIDVDIHKTLPIEYSRISELTQRTNKCTNGNRYLVAEIKERVVRESVHLYSVFVSDRFSDLGLVGAIEIEGDTLSLFSLSCRVLGHNIEEKLFEFISRKHKIKKIKFKFTGKNEDIKNNLKFYFSEVIFYDI